MSRVQGSCVLWMTEFTNTATLSCPCGCDGEERKGRRAAIKGRAGHRKEDKRFSETRRVGLQEIQTGRERSCRSFCVRVVLTDEEKRGRSNEASGGGRRRAAV